MNSCWYTLKFRWTESQKNTTHQNWIQNKCLPIRIITDPDGFTSKYCQNIKEKNNANLIKNFWKNQIWWTFPELLNGTKHNINTKVKSKLDIRIRYKNSK